MRGQGGRHRAERLLEAHALARESVESDSQIGPRIGALYAINTAGAIGGTLCAAFPHDTDPEPLLVQIQRLLNPQS